jgi:hypothetical protein
MRNPSRPKSWRAPAARQKEPEQLKPDPTIHAANISAVSNKQVAFIGAITALISAAITIPVAWVSSHSAADSAIKTTTTQITGETERSRAEFLRGQRQSAYGLFLTDYHTLANMLAEYHHSVPSKSSKQLIGAKVPAYDARYSALISKLATDLNAIELICGSPNVFNSASQLTGSASVTFDSIRAIWTSRPGSDTNHLEVAYDNFNTHLGASVKNFVEAARKDEGV